MQQSIFVSYRRDDASSEARSIYERLRSTFGDHQLFIDVDTVEAGADYRAVLDLNLSSCIVLIAVIGPDWLTARDETGARRLDNENDFVLLEISRALRRNITVIPVLVGNASLPRANELPKDLRNLAFRQAALVRHESFPEDMNVLERDIRKRIGGTRSPWLPWLRIAGLTAMCATAGFVTAAVVNGEATGLFTRCSGLFSGTECWGAVAEKNGHIFVRVEENSRENAKSAALQSCVDKAGREGCQVIAVLTKRECWALAVMPTTQAQWRAAVATSPAAAQKKAHRDCEQAFDYCRISLTFCADGRQEGR